MIGGDDPRMTGCATSGGHSRRVRRGARRWVCVMSALLACWVVAPQPARGQDAGDTAEQEDIGAPDPATSQPAATQPAEEAPLCPVSGKPIDRKIYVYFKGKRVYFDSADSRARFETDALEYAEGVKAQWERMRPLWIQARCPVTNEPLRRLDLFLEGPQSRIYFATPEAMAEWLKDPNQFRGRFPRCMSFQAQCATCDNDANPTIEARLKGKPYYFCCEGCRDVFSRKPSDFVAQVVEQTKANKEEWYAQNGGMPKRMRPPH